MDFPEGNDSVTSTPPPTASASSMGKSSLGMDANTAAGIAALSAVLGLGIVALIFFVLEKDSQFVKFHSLQALILTILIAALSIAGALLSVILIGLLFYPLVFVVWIFMIIQTIKAFGGEWYKAPLVGNLAAQWSNTQI